MKKRMLSLLCVLALCLGLLPVTALAAAEGAPNSLYVGNQQVISSSDITYWTTDESTGGLTKYEGNNDNWNVKYDPSTATLTLSGATIKGGSDVVSIPYGSGIYAQGSSNQPVTLTIELIGENTITGTFGIYVNATPPTTPGTDASLVIKKSGDNGSLTVTGTGNSGLHIISGTGDASLTIKNASVDAKTTQTYSSYAGVCVQSGASATDSPQLSLAVNGGSLTVSGSTSADGIQFYVGSSQATGATTSLTVSENAIVDARNGGISASGVSVNPNVDIGSTDSTGGIVWNGAEGTVYGEVELQKDLEIKSGETLTIPDGASLTSNDKLTNNGTVTIENGGTLTDADKVTNSGTINVEDGGKLEGTPTGGTVVKAPTITTESPLPEGTVGTEYSQTLAAENNPTSWSVTIGTLPAGLTLDTNTGTISGIPTAEGSSAFTVTAENSAGSATQEYTLTIKSVPIASVSLNESNLSLYTGKTATLTATVTPENATNKAVTWESSDDTIATVDNNGKVTAVKEGTATITATAADGSGKSATCKVTVTQSEYSISADTTILDFGSVYTGYTLPTAKTVTLTNTGNQTVTVTLPTSTNYIITAGTGFTNGSASINANGTATFTVQPKAGLAVGTYSENITISDSGHVTLSIPATFTVRQYNSGGGTPTKTPSQQATDKIESAKEGSTVEITLRTGQTKLDKEVFEALAGRDVTLEISLPGGVSWTVNGQDIPENTDLTDLDLGVSLNTSTIPVSVINTVTGAVDTIQLSLKHDGEFGFTMILSAPLGKTNAGYWANLYYYNTRTRALEFQSASKIATDGTASFPFSHASDYAIVIDTDSHEPVELPFTDVPEGAWYEDAAAYVYKHGLMAGTSATTFAPEVTTSRAMIATILWRMAGSPVVNYAMNYTDVAQGQWCSEAIRWATSEGVVTGYGNGLFGTNDPITREQLATMLWRYAQTEGYDVSIGEDTNILSYTDVADLSEYAIPAMQWAVGAGIINGTGDGSTLTPQGQATRAQAAVMLMRFCEEYVVW